MESGKDKDHVCEMYWNPLKTIRPAKTKIKIK